MSTKVAKDEGFEVQDSTDWLATPLPKVSAVEAALRCQVCKDFYTSPMITSCSHTFCSLCIRRALKENGICPGCRTPDQEMRLRFNNTVYDMVEAFKAARPEVLEYTKERPIPVARSASPKRRREHLDRESVEEGPAAKRTRSSKRIAISRTEVIDLDSEDEDYVPEKGVVQCPVCQKLVKESTINVHLDRGCMDEPSRPRSSKGLIQNSPPPTETKPLERLAQLNYSMVKDVPLRKKLVEHGLSTMGSRHMLERRYAEWVTLWNSNCDARVPRGKTELRRELDVWERTQGAKAQSSYSLDPGSQIKDKNFDGKAWATKHDDSFRDLIANARRKLPPKTASPVEPEEPSIAEPELEPPAGRMGYLTPNTTFRGTVDSVDPALSDNKARRDSQIPTQSEYLALVSQASADRHDGSHQRLFDEGNGDSIPPPSSQYSNGIPVLEKDTGISSDMTTMRTIQP